MQIYKTLNLLKKFLKGSSRLKAHKKALICSGLFCFLIGVASGKCGFPTLSKKYSQTTLWEGFLIRL